MAEPAIYFFITKPTDGRSFSEYETLEVVMARGGTADALGVLQRRSPAREGKFDARLAGLMTRSDFMDQIREFFSVDPMDRMMTAAALRYAAAGHEDTFDENQRELLGLMADRLESKALEFLN